MYYERAIEDCNRAIELDPDYDKAYYYRYLAYEKFGQQDRAKKDYNKAIELDPDIVEKQKSISGFEAISAIAGMLAVIYLLKRRV